MLPIADLIPHRGGMLLIEAVLAVDEKHAETLATAKASWPLATPYAASPLLLIELAAQTAGVCFGFNELQKPLELRNRARGGWLVGVKKVQFFTSELAVGACITTKTETVLVMEQYKEITASAYLGETLLALIQFQVLQAAS